MSSIKRVDQTERRADFHDETLSIDLSTVHGRSKAKGNSSANVSGIIDMNASL